MGTDSTSKCPLCGKKLYGNIIEHCHKNHPKKKHKWKEIYENKQ